MSRLRVKHPKVFFVVMTTCILLLLWNVGLITYATYMVFSGDLSVISASVATVYGTLTGTLSIVSGFVAKKITGSE